MKIKVALLERDVNYLNRLVMAFSTKYADKIEIHSFTNKENALDSLERDKIDVFIIGEVFEIDIEQIPSRCGIAYFVDGMGIESVNEQKAVCKFQKAELIYKQILNIYAEKASTLTGKKISESNVKNILFTSFSGGVGCSSLAAAYSAKLAINNKKVLYLNLEKMGNPELFFQGEGQFNFSDVIYALKSKKANLAMKIESSVKTSTEGVNYFAAPKIALDMLELKVEEISELLDEIESCGYQYVVIDAGFYFDDMGKMLWKKADEVIVVSDGSEISNSKLERAYNSITVIGEQDEKFRIEKANLIYNKFSNKTCKTVTGLDINEIGGIPKYEHATTKQVLSQIMSMSILDKII